MLKSISFVEEAEQQRIRELFEAAGLARERLVILPWVEGWSNHMALYRELDVALDPLPYGGATTSCEALWMGVPVLTLAGRGMVGRLSASVLAGAGCNEWIARSPEQLVGMAGELARQGTRPLPQRQDLRERMQRSGLGDPERLSRELEAIYRRVCS